MKHLTRALAAALLIVAAPIVAAAACDPAALLHRFDVAQAAPDDEPHSSHSEIQQLHSTPT
jgi:hypothetical protein